jgi:hypothetical protein
MNVLVPFYFLFVVWCIFAPPSGTGGAD